MLFRAYYATVYGRMMRTGNGIPTNAVYGFVTMFQKALNEIKPDGVMVAWDAGKPTFRHEMYADYKGTRRELDQELIVQFPIVREFLMPAELSAMNAKASKLTISSVLLPKRTRKWRRRF